VNWRKGESILRRTLLISRYGATCCAQLRGTPPPMDDLLVVGRGVFVGKSQQQDAELALAGRCSFGGSRFADQVLRRSGAESKAWRANR
jgi:hypothetical protein